MKGKQAKRHVFILRTLAIQGPKSCWDLAFESLKCDPKFSILKKASVYYKRQKENSTFYKRLKFLESKNYVRQLGSIYKLTSKGLCLVFCLDPGIVQLMPNSLFNETFQQINLEKKPTFLDEGDLTQKEIESFKAAFQNQIKNETLSFIIRRLLFAWKINLDEIGETELFRLIFTKIEREAKKQRRHIRKITF